MYEKNLENMCNQKGRAHTHSPNAVPAPGPWTTQPLTVRLTFMGTHPTSNHHLSTVDLTAIRQTHRDTARLSTHLSQDPFTQTHHQNACISFTICTCSESSSSFLLTPKITTPIVLGVLVSSPTSSTLLQHEPSYLLDAAENPRHSRSSELHSSSPFKSFYSSKSSRSPPLSLLSCLRSISSICYLSSTLCSLPLLSKKTLSSPYRLLIFLLKRSVASSRNFSKTFSSDPIRSRIRRPATLIEHTSSMPAAATSIPALSSKESHAISMQY